jgi:hypothetical protein
MPTLAALRGVAIALLLALPLAGCAVNTAGSNPASAPAPATDVPGTVDFSCRTDADCAIKDIGSCCGYYPACVNADSPTFPEQVQAECAKNDMMSVCGFPDIAGCQCVDGRCAALGAGEGPLR